MLGILVALVAYSTFAPNTPPGAITTVAIDKQIIRTDTRSGVMEACSIVGEEVKCSQLKEKK